MLDRDLENVVPSEQWQYLLSLESTQKIANIVFSCREQDELIEKSLDAILEFTNFDAIVFLLLSEDHKELEVLSARGVSEETKRKGKYLSVDNSFSGQAILQKKIISSGDLTKDHHMYAPVRDALAKDNLSSAVSIPLIYNENPYGVINILFKEHHRNLYPSDYEIMKTIGKIISIALSNVEYVNKLTREIDSRREAQLELANFNTQLEEVVSERTKSLQDALENLKGLQDSLIESEKMASLGGLVAGISHEINTPLGVSKTSVSHIETTIQALKSAFTSDNLTTDEFREKLHELSVAITILNKNIDRASELIKSFKQIAVDQSDERILDFEVRSIIKNVITTLTPRWKSKNIEFVIDVPPGLTIHNYAGALSQILTNLMINTIIHGFEHKSTGTIEFIFQEKGDNLCEIIYKDDGCGLPEEELKKIFEPFYTTKRGQGGTGLGLHLLYNLVTHKMKGSVAAHSLEPGLGFTISLPTQLTKEPEEESPQQIL